MEEAMDLVVAPFRDIADKGKTALDNADDNQDMRKAAQSLLKEGERALKKLDPICKKYWEEYGSNFIDALKSNQELSSYRSQLNDLLWEFDDYVELDDFDADKFTQLQGLSRKAAPKIIDMLMTMKLEAPPRDEAHRHFISQLSPPSSPFPDQTSSYTQSNSAGSPAPGSHGFPPQRFSSPSFQESGRQGADVRSIDGTASHLSQISDRPLSHEDMARVRSQDAFHQPSPAGSSKPQSDQPLAPPQPPTENPWDVHDTSPAQFDEQLSHAALIERRADAESPIDWNIAPVTPSRERRVSSVMPSVAEDPGDQGGQGHRIYNDAPVSHNGFITQRPRAYTQESTATSLIPETEADPNIVTPLSEFGSIVQRPSVPSSASHPPASGQAPPVDPSMTMRVVHPVQSNNSTHSQYQSHSMISHNRGPSSSSASILSHPINSHDGHHQLHNAGPSFSHHGPAPSISETISSSEPLSPTALPTRPTRHQQADSEGLIVVQNSPIPETDYGPIPVESDRKHSSVSSQVSGAFCGRNIGNGSSFYLQKGFCEGAKEITQGQMGVKKTKRAVRTLTANRSLNQQLTFDQNFTTATTVARCTHCMFDVDFKDVEEDINKWAEGNYHRRGIHYRLRFVQKSHLAAKRPDDVMFGCMFCIQQGHTIDPSDATVFFNTKALFKHLARHPRPLPKVPGLTVVEEAEVPEDLRNDIDLHFPNPPESHPVIEKASEIVNCPSGTARESARRVYGQKLLYDRTPAHELAQGARVTGLTWPDKYNGEWCYGYHEGTYATVPSEILTLDSPPIGEIKMGGMSNVQAKARWKFLPKDKERADWLKIEKGETITNIGWAHPDHWCWSGNNAKGKWGIFPSAFIDTSTLSESTPNTERVASFRTEGSAKAPSSSSTSKFSFPKMSLRNKSTSQSQAAPSQPLARAPSIAESTSSGDTQKESKKKSKEEYRPVMMNVAASYLAYKNQQFHNRS